MAATCRHSSYNLPADSCTRLPCAPVLRELYALPFGSRLEHAKRLGTLVIYPAAHMRQKGPFVSQKHLLLTATAVGRFSEALL